MLSITSDKTAAGGGGGGGSVEDSADSLTADPLNEGDDLKAAPVGVVGNFLAN